MVLKVEAVKETSEGSGRRARKVYIHVSRWWVVTFAALIALPWVLLFVIAGKRLFAWNETRALMTENRISPAEESALPAPSTRPAGPWGQLEVTPIAIDPPADYAARLLAFDSNVWTLKGYSIIQFGDLLSKAAATPEQKARLVQLATPDVANNALVIKPDASTLLSLSPSTRAVIYAELAKEPANRFQFDPFRGVGNKVSGWFEGSQLPAAISSTVERLSYRRGDAMLFSDPSLVLDTLPNNDDKVRFLRAVSRRSSILMRIKITPETDLDPLIDYWARGPQRESAKSMLESVKRIPGGYSLNVSALLPRFARKHYNQFPILGMDPTDSQYDCHWNSMNFWNDTPDDRFANAVAVATEIRTNYDPVFVDYRFGDVIFLMKSDDEAIHSGVYIADNIVFSKNGPTLTAPWTLMTLNDMLAYYGASSELKIKAFRRR